MFTDSLIKDKLTEFQHGSFVYRYFRFLERFHVEPKTTQELFEYSDYTNTDSEVKKLLHELEDING